MYILERIIIILDRLLNCKSNSQHLFVYPLKLSRLRLLLGGTKMAKKCLYVGAEDTENEMAKSDAGSSLQGLGRCL